MKKQITFLASRYNSFYNPCTQKRLFSFPKCLHWLWVPPDHIQIGTDGYANAAQNCVYTFISCFVECPTWWHIY